MQGDAKEKIEFLHKFYSLRNWAYAVHFASIACASFVRIVYLTESDACPLETTNNFFFAFLQLRFRGYRPLPTTFFLFLIFTSL